MLDLTTLARAVDGREVGDHRLPKARWLRITERCPARCPDCPRSSRPDIERSLLLRALYSLEPGPVLFAGAEPDASPLLDNAIALARAIGHDAELLTPGSQLTERRAAHLRSTGLARVRIATDSARPDRLASVRSAATATRAGLVVDLHVAVLPNQHPQALKALLDELTALPVPRVVLSTRGCRGATQPLRDHDVVEATRAAMRSALTAATDGPRICLEGRRFGVGLALRVLAQEAGTAVSQRIARHLDAWEPALPAFAAG